MLYALSTVSKSTTLDDLEGHCCVFDVVTISTEVYLFITARCTTGQSAVLRSHVVCPDPSVRLSIWI